MDVAGAGALVSSRGAWRFGVWLGRAGVDDLTTDGLAVAIGVRRGGRCEVGSPGDSVRTGVRPGSVVSVLAGGTGVGEEGSSTVASVVGVGVFDGAWVAVGKAVPDGSGGGLVGS